MTKRICALIVSLVIILCCVNFGTISAQGTETLYYYNQLSVDEKIIYDKLKSIAVGGSSGTEVPALSGVQYTFTASSNITSKDQLNNFTNTDASYKASIQVLSKYLQNTMDAFRLDNPQYFWLSDGKGVHFIYGTNSSGKKVTLSVMITSSAGDNGKISQINNKIASIGATGNDAQKVKTIHDYLCNNISYVDGANSYNLYGAMIEGKAVCQGYAYAFKVACDYYGIESVCVTGEGIGNNSSEAHMWNYVKVNGVWYAIDVTWDDQASKIFTDFFLVGSDTKAKNFGNKTFAQSHVEDGKQTSVSYKEFDYPTISTSAYNFQNPATPVPAAPSAKPTEKPTTTAKPTENSSNKVTPTPAGNGGDVNVTSKPNDNQNSEQGDEAVNTPANDVSENNISQNQKNTPVPESKDEQTDTNNNEEPDKDGNDGDEQFLMGVLLVIGAAVVIACVSIGVAVNNKKKTSSEETE